MRIGIDATPLLGPRTGVPWYTAELVRALATERPDDELVLWPITWRRPGSLDDLRLPNVSISRVRAPARALWALWGRGTGPSLERFVKADVFHGTNYLAPPSRRTPVVVTVHDLGFVRHPETVLPATRRTYERLLPGVLRRAAAVVAVSAFTRDELVDWMPEVAPTVTVIHEGPHRRPPPTGPSPLPPGPPYALFVGTLDPRKNLPLLLDALRIVCLRGVELRVVLAGGASPLVDVGRLMADRGLTDRDVIRTGYADDPLTAVLIRDARLFAFPSLYEGFGLPLVEAMEAGLPIVAARAGPTPEVVGNAAVLTDPHDPEAFAEALERVASDEALREQLVKAGRERAATFDWRRTAVQTRELYERVVTSRT